MVVYKDRIVREKMGKRWFIIIALVLVFFLEYNFGFFRIILFDLMTLDNLKYYAHQLRYYVDHNYCEAVLLYWLVYASSITVSLPWAAIMTLAGGYMFGMIAVLYIITATTVGAVGAFLIARYLVGNIIQKRYGTYLKTFNVAMQNDGGLYLFTIRLIPIVPFFIVNSLAGLTKISLSAYAVSTFLGMILPTTIFTFAGRELATIHSVNDVFSWKVLLALGLMILISIVPLVYKRCSKKR
jgi:uncharacterized membrane protein YdjX (TVP38/TMEM64 family)